MHNYSKICVFDVYSCIKLVFDDEITEDTYEMPNDGSFYQGLHRGSALFG